MSETKHTPGPHTADLHHVRDYGGRSHAFVRAPNKLEPLAAVVLAAEGCDDTEGRANAYLFAAASDLLEAARLLEAAEVERQDCGECDGEGEPEECGLCFNKFDDARIKRRLAIAKAIQAQTTSMSPSER